MKYKKFSSVRTNTMRTNKSGYKVFTDRNGKTQSVHKRVAEKKVGGKIFSEFLDAFSLFAGKAVVIQLQRLLNHEGTPRPIEQSQGKYSTGQSHGRLSRPTGLFVTAHSRALITLPFAPISPRSS